MRLIPQKAMRYLSNKELKDLWKNVLEMLGKGWQKEHKNINYVWNHPYENLVAYATLIHEESAKEKRSLELDFEKIAELEYNEADVDVLLYATRRTRKPLYNEHNGNFVHLFCVRSELAGNRYWHNFPNTRRPGHIIGIMEDIEHYKKFTPGVKKAAITNKTNALYLEYVTMRKMLNNEIFPYLAEEAVTEENTGE